MATTVKATYANGVLTPPEPLDLGEGEQVTVSIKAGRVDCHHQDLRKGD
ncbi:MAG: antitoxin family protein [Chloroflexi bacterium]|nr:antitoxin family protein [Chloroflexota bacterium]